MEESLGGEKIACPECDRFFVAEMPSAKPLTSHKGTEQSQIPVADSPAHDESVIEVIHPAVFRSHLFGVILCILLIAGGVVAIVISVPMVPAALGWGLLASGIFAILISLFFLIKWFIVSRATKLSLTTERIIYRQGIFHHITSEVRYHDVRNISLDLSLRERILGYGDLAVSSAGQDDMEIVIQDIPSPEDVAEKIRRGQ